MEILEKTNNQLSVWNNPYGISVGILSALLAVLAIGVAFVLYKQSADHKHQTKEEETQRKKSFEIFLYSSASSLKAINLHIEESKADYDKLIAEQKNKLDNADSKDIEEIRKQLDELKKEKAKVSGDMSQTVIAQWPNLRSLAMLGGGPSAHKCSSCNYGFKVKNLNKGFILSPSDKAEVTCPKCKNIDLV